MPKKRFTYREELFIAEYLVDFNATRAAIASGSSQHTAAQLGYKILKRPHVKQIIAQKTARTLAKLDLTQEMVIQGLKNLAFFDIRKLYSDDGSLKPMHELDEVTASAICGVEVEKLFKHFAKGQAEEVGTTTKVKTADRGLNLERLGRHLKLFTDRVEHTGLEALAVELEKARQRVAG